MTTNRWSYVNIAGIQFGGAAAVLTSHDLRGASHTDVLRPTAALYATMSRIGTTLAGQTLLTSGRLHLAALYLPTGTLISSITFFSGGTAAVTPTNQWFALYDSARALLRQTVDDTTTAWAGSNKKTLALSSPFTTTYDGLHYLGIMVAAATVPSIIGITSFSSVLGQSPIVNGFADTGLTTTAPNPAAAITSSNPVPYAWVA